jgi:branched-chain amino acid transport system permease protein
MEFSLQARGEKIKMKNTSVRKRGLIFIGIGWALLLIGDRVDELALSQGALVATYALAIASIILLTGYSGQLSLGHSALMAVGAYAAALSTNNLGLSPAIALVVAAFVAGIFGLILGFGVARLSGPDLAGTTLALAVSLPTIANQFAILGGEQGVAFDIGLPPARFGELNIKGSRVLSFSEKKPINKAWINGGFFVINKKFINLIKNNKTITEDA